jgi:PEP-CTERM motif
MRFLAPCALFCAVALSAAAHAETVKFTLTPAANPAAGKPITFTLDASDPDFTDPDFVAYNTSLSPGSEDIIAFYNPAETALLGDGPLNFEIQTDRDNVFSVTFFEGAQLYSGTESDPVFTSGAYQLDAATIFGDDETATLVIDAAPSTVPEPSSIFLLGTGVLSLAGAIRRRTGNPLRR